MGQQQLLLIILGVIIVGVAIQVGIMMFSSQSMKANQDAILMDLTNLAADVYQFKIRPTIMGGGNGTYAGYIISVNGPWGIENPNATYEIITQTNTTLELKATSRQIDGATINISYNGNFKVIAGPTMVGFN
ncbi:MAG: hypothetical protein HY960_02385 [Ignavibacteriae bacterium]|nr:hypothetical protein [Ignavibacteriota bacterium]